MTLHHRPVTIRSKNSYFISYHNHCYQTPTWYRSSILLQFICHGQIPTFTKKIYEAIKIITDPRNLNRDSVYQLIPIWQAVLVRSSIRLVYNLVERAINNLVATSSLLYKISLLCYSLRRQDFIFALWVIWKETKKSVYLINVYYTIKVRPPRPWK